MPTPRYKAEVAAVPRTHAAAVATDQSDRITEETVDGIAPGGYVIRGVLTPTRTSAQFSVGDLVSVQWRRGAPFMILSLRHRRGAADDTPSSDGGLVEELFIHGAKGTRDVYYRNDQQVTKLDVRKLLPEDPTRLRWGKTDNAFVVLCEPSYTFWVFALRRAPRKAAGASKQRAVLKQMVDLAEKDITLLDFRLKSHSNPVEHIQEINPQAGSGYELGENHSFTLGQDFDGHLVQKVDVEELAAGQANVLDGSVDSFSPNNRVIGPEFQTVRFQFISDFWLDGDGSKSSPYTVVASLLTDYIVNGNDTFDGESRFLNITCTFSPAPGHDGFVLNYVVTDGKWAGDLRTRAGYVIDVTNRAVLHSGTGAASRTFDNTIEGGDSTQPILVDRVDAEPSLACTNLQPTNFLPGEDFPPEGDTGLTFTADQVFGSEISFALNLLDPTGSPFMLEDPLTETIVTSPSGPTYYAISGQAKPNVPVFLNNGTIGGQTIHASVNTFRMVTMSILSFDAKDQSKTRIFAVLRHNSGSFHSVLPEEYVWAVKVVLLDGLFNVKAVLSDWRRQIYKSGVGIGGFKVGAVTVLGSNGRHVMWREQLGSAPTGDPDNINGAQYVPTLRTLLCVYNPPPGGAVTVKVVGSDGPGDTAQADEFSAHHFKVLGEEVDLFYESREGDRDTSGRRFVKAWDFKSKAPTLDQAAAGYPAEDARFKRFKRLKNLPAGVAPDVGDGTYHGVFDTGLAGGGIA